MGNYCPSELRFFIFLKFLFLVTNPKTNKDNTSTRGLAKDEYHVEIINVVPQAAASHHYRYVCLCLSYLSF